MHEPYVGGRKEGIRMDQYCPPTSDVQNTVLTDGFKGNDLIAEPRNHEV